jgi:hypothetical protein
MSAPLRCYDFVGVFRNDVPQNGIVDAKVLVTDCTNAQATPLFRGRPINRVAVNRDMLIQFS